MADEKLRLQAEVRDNMSPAIRKIKDLLNSVRASPSMKAATAEMQNLGAATSKFAGIGGSAATALDAIGIGGLATAGSLAGVVLQMRALGQRSLDMKELGRETGVTTDWLNAWSHAGLNFGVSADAMQSSLDHLTSQMPQFKNHIGELYGLLSQKWPNLTQRLLGENSEQQVQEIIKFLDQLKNQPQLQKQLAGEFFGNGADIEKLMRNGAKGFFDEFARMQKSLNPINPDLLKQAQAFRDATTAFNISLENFENSAGPTFLKQMTSIVGEAKSITDALDGKPANPSEPNKLWGSLSHGDIAAFGKELGKVFVNSVQTELGMTAAQKAAADKHAMQSPPTSLPATPPRSSASGLFRKSAFITGDSPRASTYIGLAGIISDGTKSGVIAAFREMMATNEAANGNAGAGFTQASYETGGFDSPAVAAGRRIGRAERSGSDSGNLEDGGAYNERLGRVGSRMQAKAQESYDFWRSQGFNRTQALGFLGNEQGEGTMGSDNPALHWDGSHYSGGLVQWDPARRAAIAKALGIDVWHDRNHLHQLQAEAWELRKRYPQLWEALKNAKTIGQVTGGLVRHYELPADRVHQPGVRAGYGVAWGSRVHDDRRATGLASNAATGSAKAAAATEGHIEAHVHVHGNVHKATVKTTGRIEASLHRWPKMSDVA